MPVDRRMFGERLRRERETSPYWSREEMARRLRSAADFREMSDLPHIKSLAHMIKEWEAGKHAPGPRYRTLYCRALDKSTEELFGSDTVTRSSLWYPLGVSERSNEAFTPDDEERIDLALAQPARLDSGMVATLTTVLAGQRRLEDAIGPAALLTPVIEQMNAITAVLDDASGPHRRPFGRVVAEWTIFAGWLHAALRRDDAALALFGRAEELADDFGDGTLAMLATSFRGYVARQRERPRAVVRAAGAALATPGGHPVQRTFDLLQAAQGHAALGGRDQARRLLDSAAERTAEAIDPPSPVYWYSEPFFRLNIGMVYRELGEYRDATEMFSTAFVELPADQRGAEWLNEYRGAYADAKDRA